VNLCVFLTKKVVFELKKPLCAKKVFWGLKKYEIWINVNTLNVFDELKI